jgi:hypothetical protein
VLAELTDKPTLLAIVSEMYTQEHHIRPFMPLAERFAGRLEIILCAEWPQAEREKEGESLLAALALAPEARPRLLRDEGDVRVGVVLRAKQPVALIDLYFAERAPPSPLYADDGREVIFTSREERVAIELSQLLTRLPAQPPAPPPAPLLKAGEHDFNRGGVCRLCADGPMSRRPCPGTQSLKSAEEKSRDRFELIELE